MGLTIKLLKMMEDMGFTPSQIEKLTSKPGTIENLLTAAGEVIPKDLAKGAIETTPRKYLSPNAMARMFLKDIRESQGTLADKMDEALAKSKDIIATKSSPPGSGRFIFGDEGIAAHNPYYQLESPYKWMAQRGTDLEDIATDPNRVMRRKYPEDYEHGQKMSGEPFNLIPNDVREAYEIPWDVRTPRQAVRALTLKAHEEAGTVPKRIRVFHGSRQDIPHPPRPVFHVGTKQSAIDRLGWTPGARKGGSPGGRLYEYMMEPKSRKGMFDLVSDEYANEIGEALKDDPNDFPGFIRPDIIPYANKAEDIGNISYVVVDPNVLKPVKRHPWRTDIGALTGASLLGGAAASESSESMKPNPEVSNEEANRMPTSLGKKKKPKLSPQVIGNTPLDTMLGGNRSYLSAMLGGPSDLNLNPTGLPKSKPKPEPDAEMKAWLRSQHLLEDYDPTKDISQLAKEAWQSSNKGPLDFLSAVTTASPEMTAAKEKLYDLFDPSGSMTKTRMLGDVLLPSSPLEAGLQTATAESIVKPKVWKNLVKTEGEMAPKVFKPLAASEALGAEAGALKIPSKADRARAFIEKAGGKDIEYDETNNLIRWKKGKDTYEANLNDRFGPRQLGTAPRQEGLAPRQTMTNPKSPLLAEMNKAGEPQFQPLGEGGFSHAINPKTGTFSLRGPNGEKVAGRVLDDRIEMTSIGKGNAENSKSAIDALKDFSRTQGKDVYFTSTNLSESGGKFRQRMMDRGDLVKTDNGLKLNVTSPEDLQDIKLGDLPHYQGERGAFGKLAPLPNVQLKGKYKFDTKLNNLDIQFANDFDKAAYTLASGKPNNALLREMVNQLNAAGLNIDENTILSHGTRLRSMAAREMGKVKPGATSIELTPKQLRVPGPEEVTKPGWRQELLMAPTEIKFAGDLPAMRQSYRPFLLHPIKSGLPALKNALRSTTEQGFRNVLEELSDSPVYKRLEQHRALPTDTERLFPNIKTLENLPSSDLDAYFLGGSRLEDIPGIGTAWVKPSRRMFDAFQKTIRGKEVERLVPDLDALLTGGDEEARTLQQVINRVSDETGFGTFGKKLDPAVTGLSQAFTAPRNMAAKFQFYNPLNYVPENWLDKSGMGQLKKLRRNIGGTKDVAYKDFVKDQLKLMAGQGAGLYAAHKAGADVDMNPFSSNFGVRFGNFKPDLFGGESGIVRQLARMNPFETERVSARGKPYEASPLADTARFVRGRLRPGAPSMAWDLFNYDPDVAGWNQDAGKWNRPGARTNWLGEDISKPYTNDNLEGRTANALGAEGIQNVIEKLGLQNVMSNRWLMQQFSPSWPGDIMSASEEGMAPALFAATVGALGSGSSTYDPFAINPYRPPKRVIKVLRRKPGQYEKTHSKGAKEEEAVF